MRRHEGGSAGRPPQGSTGTAAAFSLLCPALVLPKQVTGPHESGHRS